MNYYQIVPGVCRFSNVASDLPGSLPMPHSRSSCVISDLEAPHNSFGIPSHLGCKIKVFHDIHSPWRGPRLDGEKQTCQSERFPKSSGGLQTLRTPMIVIHNQSQYCHKSPRAPRRPQDRSKWIRSAQSLLLFILVQNRPFPRIREPRHGFQ